MGVELDGKFGAALHGLDELGSLVRHQQTCHVLDTDGVRTHLLDSLSRLSPVLQRIGVTQGVGQCHLRMAPAFLLLHPVGGIYSLLQIAQVVETVKDTDNVNSVGDGLLDKSVHHVVRIGPVAQNILTAEKHLELGILKTVPELAKPLPGIFLQETKGSVKSGAAPALHGVVSHFIHLLHNGKHKIRGHSGGDQGLMRVTQNGFRNFNRCFCLF